LARSVALTAQGVIHWHPQTAPTLKVNQSKCQRPF
jgi:hypothetical protein